MSKQKSITPLLCAVGVLVALFSGCPNLGETLERDKNTLKIMYDRSEGSIRYNGSMVWTSPLEKYPRPDSFTLEAVPAKSEGYWFDSFRLGEAIWGGTDYVITIEENPFVADFTSGTLRGDINRIEVVFHRFVFEWTAPVGDGSGDLYSIASRTNEAGSKEYRLVRIDADGELDARSKARFTVVADLDIGGISSAQKVAGGVFLQDSVSKDCFVVRLSSADVLERELIYGAELEKQYGTVIGAAHDTSRLLVWNIEEAWSGVSDFVSYGIYDYRAAEGERYTEVCTRPYENGEDFDWDRSALSWFLDNDLKFYRIASTGAVPSVSAPEQLVFGDAIERSCFTTRSSDDGSRLLVARVVLNSDFMPMPDYSAFWLYTVKGGRVQALSGIPELAARTLWHGIGCHLFWPAGSQSFFYPLDSDGGGTHSVLRISLEDADNNADSATVSVSTEFTASWCDLIADTPACMFYFEDGELCRFDRAVKRSECMTPIIWEGW